MFPIALFCEHTLQPHEINLCVPVGDFPLQEIEGHLQALPNSNLKDRIPIHFLIF